MVATLIISSFKSGSRRLLPDQPELYNKTLSHWEKKKSPKPTNQITLLNAGEMDEQVNHLSLTGDS